MSKYIIIWANINEKLTKTLPQPNQILSKCPNWEPPDYATKKCVKNPDCSVSIQEADRAVNEHEPAEPEGKRHSAVS